MSNVIPILRGRSPPMTAHAEFCAARGTMLSAFLAWAQTKPDPASARDEIDSTLSAMRQLAKLYGAQDGR